MKNEKESLFKFPCKYPIKVVGKQPKDETETDFEKAVIAIFNNHIKVLDESAIEKRTSKDGNYLSLTVTVDAESKTQLDALYKDLTEHHLTVWVL
jgi:putative lipoic acid-binding regulatory protein